ncbi:MAG: hypothetical protein ACLTDR_16165 [Adlercreutzia equolifaciens]
MAEFAPRILWDRETAVAHAASRFAAPGRNGGRHHSRPRHVLGGAAGGRRPAGPPTCGRAGRGRW